MIHKSAIIDPKAKIGKNVKVGPFSVIGSNVEIGQYSKVGNYVWIFLNTTLINDKYPPSEEIIGPVILTIPTFSPVVSKPEFVDKAPNLNVKTKMIKVPSLHHNQFKLVLGLIFSS